MIVVSRRFRRKPALRLSATFLACLLLLPAVSGGASPRDAPPDPGYPPAIEELSISSGGAMMRRQLQSASVDEMDTRSFGPALRGKSVFMVVGEEDTVTTPEEMFKPVVAAYERVEGLDLEHHIIPGDHSFSWSRLLLTRLVLDWLERDCRRLPD